MAHVSADATPVPPPIELVCLHALAGDTPSLCAAACVSRDWHAAVTGTASAWRALALGETARGALTDARLLALVARACGNLESVDLRRVPPHRCRPAGGAGAAGQAVARAAGRLRGADRRRRAGGAGRQAFARDAVGEQPAG
jgi:hypothetical protein